jgi:hypothetical protein
MSLLLQVEAEFCTWSCMQIKREKLVATCFDFKLGVTLPAEGILCSCSALTSLAEEEAFSFLGVRASLVGVVRSRLPAASGSVARHYHRRRPAPCMAAEKEHIVTATRDIVSKVKRHQYLLG